MVEFIFEKFGKGVTDFLGFFGGVGRLCGQAARDTITPPRYTQLLLDQVYAIGYKSLTLVIVTCFSTGMVIALQFSYGLEKFGGQLYVPKIIMPPNRPIRIPKTVRMGSAIWVPIKRGITIFLTGFVPKARMASICSVTFITNFCGDTSPHTCSNHE